MPQRFYEKDGNLEFLKDQTVAIVGYGSQGHAHALNLADSGVDVMVGLRPGSKSWQEAEEAGLRVGTVPEAVKDAMVVGFLLPDGPQAQVYRAIAETLRDRLDGGSTVRARPRIVLE